MYISIRSTFTTDHELYTEAIAQKQILFRLLVSGTDEEYASAANSFAQTLYEANINSSNSFSDKKFIILYSMFQTIPLLLVHGIKETEFNINHLKYYYEIECLEDIKDSIQIVTDFFISARNYYKASQKKVEYSPFINECINYINNNIYEKFDLEELANKLHYNSYYLSKKFKKETNMSVIQYVLQAKINEARILLEKNHSIKSVSDKLAFSSQSYFTECFKKAIGITPKQFQYIIKK